MASKECNPLNELLNFSTEYLITILVKYFLSALWTVEAHKLQMREQSSSITSNVYAKEKFFDPISRLGKIQVPACKLNLILDFIYFNFVGWADKNILLQPHNKFLQSVFIFYVEFSNRCIIGRLALKVPHYWLITYFTTILIEYLIMFKWTGRWVLVYFFPYINFYL